MVLQKQENGSEIQSVLFDKDKWTVERAKAWLKRNDLKSSKLDETEDKLRFRQKDPAQFKRFRNIKGNSSGSIQFVIGFLKREKFKKQAVDLEEINKIMIDLNYPEEIREHVLQMFASFTIEEIAMMDAVFSSVVEQQMFSKQEAIDSVEIDFDALNLYMGMQELSDKEKSLTKNLLNSFTFAELDKVANIISETRYQAWDKSRVVIENIKLVKNDSGKKKTMGSEYKDRKEFKESVRLFNKTAQEVGTERLVYGVVIEPGNIDTDHEWTDEENIRKACHLFMKHFQEFGIEHEIVLPNGLVLVENFIAPDNFIMNGQAIKKGSWVMAHFVKDDIAWQDILDGELTGYSFEGLGILIDEIPN
jgi:hypothetical protein